MLDRPSLDSSKIDRTDHADDESTSTPTGAENDPWRQLFGRHSNHLDGNQVRRLRTSLRQRLFADESP